MRENYTVYKLLEVIEMPADTKVHMINGLDYKINAQGELVPELGEKLPISKKNIDNCEFTIIEEIKNYNFRVYKDDKLILSFNKIIEESRTKRIARDLYDEYQNDDESSWIIPPYDNSMMFYMPRHIVEVKVEEIIE